MPYKDKEKQAEYMRKYRTPYMREYRKRKKPEREKRKRIIAELKVLASHPLTVTRASELIETIKQL